MNLHNTSTIPRVLAFSAILLAGIFAPSCSPIAPHLRSDTAVASNTSISSVAQFNELMEKMAMNLTPTFSFSYAGNAGQLVKNSLWGDYSGTYRTSRDASGKCVVALEYPCYVKILAAYRNPALESKLNAREKSTLSEAKRLVRKLRPSNGTRFDYLVNIHDYLTKECKADLQGSDCATELLLNEHGACWAHSRAFYLLAQMAGIPCHIVNGHAGGAEHSWNMIQMENGEWYHIDTTWDDPITRGADAGDTIEYHRYFLMCDYHMGKDHSWNHTPFPASGHQHATYYVNKHLVFDNSADFWREAKKAYYSGKFEYEGWMTNFNEDEFRAEMKKMMKDDAHMTSCGWIGPKEKEGSVRVLFN